MRLLLLIAILSTSAFSQLTAEQLQAKIKEQKIKDVSVGYDKYRDASILWTKPFNLVGSWEGGGAIVLGGKRPFVLMLGVRTVSPGRTFPANTEKAVLYFASQSKDWAFLGGDRNVYILFDGQRLQLAPVTHTDEINTGFGDVTVSETLQYEIALTDLEKIAAAKDVSVLIGPKPRTIKPDLLLRLGAFVRLLR